jgi:hypothetical protein
LEIVSSIGHLRPALIRWNAARLAVCFLPAPSFACRATRSYAAPGTPLRARGSALRPLPRLRRAHPGADQIEALLDSAEPLLAEAHFEVSGEARGERVLAFIDLARAAQAVPPSERVDYARFVTRVFDARDPSSVRGFASAASALLGREAALRAEPLAGREEDSFRFQGRLADLAEFHSIALRVLESRELNTGFVEHQRRVIAVDLAPRLPEAFQLRHRGPPPALAEGVRAQISWIEACFGDEGASSKR